MKRIVSLLLAVICLLVSGSSFSEEESAWKGFRGIPWGASQKEIISAEKTSPRDIHETSLYSGDFWTCLSYENVRVSRHTAYLEYDLVNGSLVDGLYFFHTSVEKMDEDYDWLKEALTDLYGSPSDQGMELVQGFFELGILGNNHFIKSTVWSVGGTAIALYINDGNELIVLYYGKDYHESHHEPDAGKYEGL